MIVSPRHLQKTKRRIIWLACRRITAVLGLFVLLSQATFADSIQINRVVQTIRPMRGMVDLRVDNLAQDPASPDIKGTLKSGSKTKNSDSLASSSGAETGSQQQQIAVEVVGDAVVEGTVCDCGEILVPGGFAKWPLIFLAAIPLIFIHDCEDCDTPTPTCTTCNVIVTPTPTPTPPSSTTTPEPATLLLFGTGLLAVGATLRRRYSISKATDQAQTDGE